MYDIMDAAPLRRGHTTVHEKWDLNTEFYLRDAMLFGLSILRKLSMNILKLLKSKQLF
jgi:geranylgeranyl pyrophosphate synthase